MKNKLFIIAIITVIGFTMIACEKKDGSSGGSGSGGSGSAESGNGESGGSGVKIITSADELKAYLDKQPANTPDKPINVTVSINDIMMKSIANVIKSADKYAILHISGNILTTIPKNVFYACDTLVGITIPNSVTNIGDLAFSSCTNLSRVNIPDSVTSIGYGSFEKCTDLTGITIGNGVTKIESSAFFDCKGLTHVIMGNSVTTIGRSAFFGCKNLTSITFKRSGTELDNTNEFIDDDNTASLRTAYTKGGIGTYTRQNTRSTIWTKQ